MAPELSSVTAILEMAGCVAAREEAVELIRAAGGDEALLDSLLARRTHGEPIAWIVGSATFCDVELQISPGVYVPRWQTEPLARRAASMLSDSGIAVDLCTGSGAIAAVMGRAVPTARVLATDIDAAAVRDALANGVEALVGFLDEPLPPALESRVDVMTAVVPYVPTNSLRLLPRDVQEFEPRVALDGGPDGTDMLVQVVTRAPRWLRPSGWLLLELGGDQAEKIGAVLRSNGFSEAEVMTDVDGDLRGVVARMSG
ncbi:MAG: HemK/PrmC family methyltransferase [Acidimicrobiales bacterium]